MASQTNQTSGADIFIRLSTAYAGAVTKTAAWIGIGVAVAGFVLVIVGLIVKSLPLVLVGMVSTIALWATLTYHRRRLQ